jgi:hypothetical protein
LGGSGFSEAQRHAGFERGQDLGVFVFVFCLVRSVFFLFVRCEVAVELDDGAIRSEHQVLIGADVGRDGVVDRRVHLRSNEPSPDEQIQFVFIDRKVVFDCIR